MTGEQIGGRLATRVFDRLLADIVSGRLLPGMPLSELDLCESLGVSRTPVREALIKLAEADLVRIVPKRGSYVAPIALQGFADAQFIRENLECALVAEAARQIDASALAELNALLESQRQAKTGDAFFQLDEAFHAAIAGRTSVWKVIRQTKLQFDRVRRLSLLDGKRIPLLVEQHREVVEGLAACDEARAVAAMRRHLRGSLRTVSELIAKQEQAAGTMTRRSRRRRAELEPA